MRPSLSHQPAVAIPKTRPPRPNSPARLAFIFLPNGYTNAVPPGVFRLSVTLATS